MQSTSSSSSQSPATSSSSSQSPATSSSSSHGTSSSSSLGHSTSSSSSYVKYSSSSSSGDERCPSPDDDCVCDPCKCPACPYDGSPETIRYFNGEFQYSVTAFSVSSYGLPWGHTRYYSNQRHRGADAVSEDLGHGTNWLAQEWPYITNRDRAGTQLAISLGQNRNLFFQKSGSDLLPLHGAQDQYKLEGPFGGHYTLTGPDGTVWDFWAYNTAHQGRLSSVTLPSGQFLSINYPSSSVDTPNVVNLPSGDMLLYAYSSGQLSTVTLQRPAGGSSWTNVRREAYTYHDGSDAYGNPDDLKTATVQFYDGSSWIDEETRYYRYYKDDAAGKGFKYGMKYVVEPEAYRRVVAAGQSPLTASDGFLGAYADYYLEYDPTTHRVTKEKVMGGLRTYTFAYTPRTGTLTDDYSQWRRKTVMTQPDNSTVTVFTNHVGQVVLHELKESGTNKTWCNHFQYDTQGRAILHAHPSAVASWSLPGTGSDLSVTLKNGTTTGTGLIELTEYPTATTATSTTLGDVLGYEKAKKIKKGSGATPIVLREMEYYLSNDSTGVPVTAVVGQETAYRDDAASEPIETSYSYTWSGDVLLVERITTLPAVPTAQNGSDTSNTRTERYDSAGNLIWVKDERGLITNQSYDAYTSALTQTIVDVDDTQVTVPSGWATPSGGGLHLVTDYTVDTRGHVTMVKGPSHLADLGSGATAVRSITTTLYLDDDHEVRTAQGCLSGSGFTTCTLYNPISITKLDEDGRVVEQIQATRGSGATTSGDLSSSDTFARSSYVRWTTNTYNKQSQLTDTRVYYDIPSSGVGTNQVHYSRTAFTYDSMGRQASVESPGGTTTFTTYDARGLVLTVSVGWSNIPPADPSRPWQNQVNPFDVDDNGEAAPLDALLIISEVNAFGEHALTGSPSGPPYYDADGDGWVRSADATLINGYSNPTSNKVVVTTNEYDGGSPGGDGNLTTERRQVDSTSGNDRLTTYSYDWRNRRTVVDGEVDLYAEYTYDNLDRVTRVERYGTDDTGDLIAKQETNFDDLGRVYQTIRYAVDPSTGTVGNDLTDNTWFDEAGNVIKQQPAGSAAFTKTQYDGVGRAVKTFVGYDTSETDYEDAFTVDDDTILEQTETVYDEAGSPTQITTRRRMHDATGTGELTEPGGSAPEARVTYMAMWYDGIGRQTGNMNIGTNGGSALSRPDNQPSHSIYDVFPYTTTEFNERGEPYKTIGPLALESRVEFDDAGRKTKTIQNYVDGDPTNGPDQDVTVEYTYHANGQIKTIKAK